MTKIDIISGFLGAGKTTLIKKLLQEALSGEQIVLIENEFGEIGIDGGFLQEAGVEIREMNSGCICCSLVGDFGKSLTEVLTKYQPDRVVIEPSGVGKLSDVMKAVTDVNAEAGVTLNSSVVVVDALKCKMYMKNFGEFFNNQIENSNTIVLSRTDNMADSRIEQVVAMIREHNPNAQIITTPWTVLEGSQILEAMENRTEDMAADLMKEVEAHHHEECGCGHHHHHDDEECECGHHHHHDDEECECGHHHHHHDHDGECSCGCGHDHHHHHHHADEVFTSWGLETAVSYEKTELEQILEQLADTEDYGIVLRAKGMVAGADGQWIYFDLVPEEYEMRAGSPEYTGRICVIGTDLKEDALKELFHI